MAERIPPEALSRVSSYDWMGSLLLLPVGYLLAGSLADATSAERRARRGRAPHGGPARAGPRAARDARPAPAGAHAPVAAPEGSPLP